MKCEACDKKIKSGIVHYLGEEGDFVCYECKDTLQADPGYYAPVVQIKNGNKKSIFIATHFDWLDSKITTLIQLNSTKRND